MSCTESLLINGGKDEDEDDEDEDEDEDDHLDLSQGDRHGNKTEPEVRQGKVEDEQISEQKLFSRFLSSNFWVLSRKL